MNSPLRNEMRNTNEVKKNLPTTTSNYYSTFGHLTFILECVYESHEWKTARSQCLRTQAHFQCDRISPSPLLGNDDKKFIILGGSEENPNSYYNFIFFRLDSCIRIVYKLYFYLRCMRHDTGRPTDRPTEWVSVLCPVSFAWTCLLSGVRAFTVLLAHLVQFRQCLCSHRIQIFNP